MRAGVFRVLANLWPPLFFAGIKINALRRDYREARVTLYLRWYTRNYVGVQYGGSLMSMTDPWYMLMLMNNLGNDYYVWDKHAEIDYISPGKSHVQAHFVLTQAMIDDVKANTASGEKYLPTYTVEIRDRDNTLVARVKRTIYIKLKPRARRGSDESPPC